MSFTEKVCEGGFMGPVSPSSLIKSNQDLRLRKFLINEGVKPNDTY